MNYSIFRFTLNMHTHRSQVSVPTMRGDTAVRLLITLTDGGNTYTLEDGCVAILNGLKPDGKPLVNGCTILNNAIIQYDFTEQTSNVEGIVECELSVYGKDGSLVTTARFAIVVGDRVLNGGIEESVMEATGLDGIFLHESARVEAEAERAEAEEARAKAETERRSNEIQRQQNEAARLTIKDYVIDEELKRQEAESNRVVAEEARQSAMVDFDRRMTVMEAVSEGVSFLEEIDSTAAYEKAVPRKAAPYAALTKVGGVTVRAFEDTNLIDHSFFQGTDGAGVTVTVDSDGFITLNGTSNGGSFMEVYNDFGTAGLEHEPKYIAFEHISGSVTVENVYDVPNLWVLSDAAAHGYGIELKNGQKYSLTWYWCDGAEADEQEWAESHNRLSNIYVYADNGVTFNNYKFRFTVSTRRYFLQDTAPTAIVSKNRNLIPFPYATKSKTEKGITFTVQEDGGIKVVGTATADAGFELWKNPNLEVGVSYTISGGKDGVTTLARKQSKTTGKTATWVEISNSTKRPTGTLEEDEFCYIVNLYVVNGTTVNTVIYPQFERGETATAYKKQATVDTVTLPDLSDLEGWGTGVGAVGGNHIELTDDGRALYRRTTKRLVLPDDVPIDDQQYCVKDYTFNGKKGVIFWSDGQGRRPPKGVTDPTKVLCVCNNFEAVTANLQYEKGYSKRSLAVTGNIIRFYDPTWESLDSPVEAFKAECRAFAESGNPTILEYALDEVVETDISDRLDLDGFLEVDGNGTIVAENAHKADIPSTLTYMVSLRGE